MPVIKHSDKVKSKSVGSSIDKLSTGGSSKSSKSSASGGSKFNLKFEKVNKSDGSSTSKKLKCVTSNFKCLFYKRNKGRESDGRSESSKSSSPTGDSISSSGTPSDGCVSPDLGDGKVDKIPIPAERKSRKNSTSGGTLDRPIPAPRTSIIRPSCRIPSQEVIYGENTALHNFHLQSLGNFPNQGHLLFRTPHQNFRRPPPPPPPGSGPPLPPRNHSNFPSVVYAPQGHGPMVAYVRGPFPPSRHQSAARPPPPNKLIRIRAGHSQQAFILRCPPPPRILFRSPYEHPNYCLLPEPPLNQHHPHYPYPSHGVKHPLSPLQEDDYGPTSTQSMPLPSLPPRHESLSPESFSSLTDEPNINEVQRMKKGSFLQRPSQIPNDFCRNKENSKVEGSKMGSYLDKKPVAVMHVKSDAIVSHQSHVSLSPSGGDPSLWPTVVIDHKLPRVPNPIQDNHQRQRVTQMRRKASLDLLTEPKAPIIYGSASCSDLRKIEERNEKNNKKHNSWFRWFGSRADGENKKDSGKWNPSSPVSVNNNNEGNTHCVRCSKVLPKSGENILSQPVQCSICSLRVCKGCAVWNQAKNTLTCGHCHPPTSVDKKVNFWLDGVSHGDGSFVTAERDKTTEEVREHLERLVESYIDEGVESVSLSRLFDNSQYDVLFHRFHQKLSDALMNLGYSLKLAIENKPLSETPTQAHTTLTNLLVQAKEAAMELPVMEPASVKTKDEIIAHDEKKGEGQPSYEDVLATAILNKVVLNGQKARNKSDSPMSLVDSAVQTDSEMSETNEIISQKNQYNVQGWVTNLEKRSPQQHSNLSDDDLSMGTSSSNWSNEGASHRGGTHQQIVIEEQVEEITTTYESDSDIGHSPPVRNRKLRKSGRRNNNSNDQAPGTVVKNDDPLFGIDLTNFEKRVPFPEGGVDIISPTEADTIGILPEDDQQDPKTSALLVSQISEWEQNWLFKRRKQLFKKRNLMAEAVPMLVPNPNEEGVEPQIGAEKASDLSDLSDHVVEDDEEGDFTLSSSEEEEDVEKVSKPAGVADAKNERNSKEQEQPKIELIAAQVHPQENNKPPAAFADLKVTQETTKDSVKKEETGTKKNSIVPKKPERKVEKGVAFVTIPQDFTTSAGKTAKFVCAIADSSPAYSVAWFFDGVLLTSQKGKRWIDSAENRHNHYLYIYDVNEKDAGSYHLSVFDHRGNETKHVFKLIVTDAEQRKTEPPTFTVLREVVKVSDDEPVLTIPFEISGFPEPYLEIHRNNVEISKLSHVLLEDKGNGKWVLQIRKKDTSFPIYGEYIAVAKNKGGMAKVTFQIQHTEAKPTMVAAVAEAPKMTKETLAIQPETDAKSLSPQPRPLSVASEVSSIEETLRETSQSMDANQTLFKEDYEELLEWERRNMDASKMTIAEREKLKWQNPVNLPYNPYAPENLAKRIRQRENSGFALPPSKSGEIGVSSSDDDERPTSVDRIAQNYQKFSRDYYVHGVTPSSGKLPMGPKFASTTNLPSATGSSPANGNSASSDKEEDAPKKQPLVPRKITALAKDPVLSNSDNSLNKGKVPLPLERSQVRNRFEEMTKRESEPEINKLPKPSPRASPDKDVTDSVRKLATPSPTKSRSGSEEKQPLPTPVKRDSAELQTIKLPSVKQLAQQFNKEKSPERTDAKVKESPKPVPLQNHLTRNLIKDSKSIQQPVRPTSLSAPPKTPPVQRQQALFIDSPSMVRCINETIKAQMKEVEGEKSNDNQSKDTDELEKCELVGNLQEPENVAPEGEANLLEMEDDDEEDDEEVETEPAPPLPVTPPPKKTPTLEEPILELFDPLQESVYRAPSPRPEEEDYITEDSYPTVNYSEGSRDFPKLESVPDSFVPNWSKPQSEPSFDMDLLQFELRTDEQDHLPPSILPDTPQLASLATTITDMDQRSDSDGNFSLTDELERLKESHDPQPFFKTFNSSTPTPKRNSWNTTSSFAYDPQSEYDSPTDLIHDDGGANSDTENEDDHVWSENTPSIIPARSTPSSQSESPTKEHYEVESPPPRANIPQRSASRVKNIAAMFEGNSSPDNSSWERARSSKSSSAATTPSYYGSNPMLYQQPPPTPKRPTAMEVLATPTPSMRRKQLEQDSEVDLRRLRRNILREARSAMGSKTESEDLPVEAKLKRAQSLNMKDNQEPHPQAQPRRERPKSLIIGTDVETTI